MAFVATIVSVVLRFFVCNYWEQRRGTGPFLPLDWRVAQLSVAGTIAGAAMLELGPRLAQAGGVQTVAVAVLVTIGACCGLAIYRKHHSQPRGNLLTVAGVLTLGSILVAIWHYTIVADAKRFANGREYCLLVADGDRHNRQAASLLELSPLMMRATEHGARAINRHGAIVIEGRPTAHWSYMRGKFLVRHDGTMADDMLKRDTRCVPTKHFAEKLPLF